MAHRLALQAKAPTVVTLPSGLATLYPESLKEWILPICESGGAFVSEYHPRTVMRKWHFQERNRLIAGLSLWTFIVEGKLRSGTWLTAKKALNAGREIAALGASPWMTGFSGNLALLADGATMIRDAQDLVMFLSRDSRVNSIGGVSLEEVPCDHH
jgi:DNA processing protein